MGLLQRVFDACDLTTVSLTTLREYTEFVKPSLAAYLEHPFGFTLGDVKDEKTQIDILKTVLNLTTEDHAAGTIIDLPYRWTRDDLRDMQLQKLRK